MLFSLGRKYQSAIGAAISAKMQRLRKENQKEAIVAMHMMK